MTASATRPGWVFLTVTFVVAAVDAVLPLFNRFLCSVGEYDDAIGCTDWPADAPWIGSGVMLLVGLAAWKVRDVPLLLLGVAAAVGFGLWGWSAF